MESTDRLLELASELVHTGEYRLAKKLFEVAVAERTLREEECGGFEEPSLGGLRNIN